VQLRMVRGGRIELVDWDSSFDMLSGLQDGTKSRALVDALLCSWSRLRRTKPSSFVSSLAVMIVAFAVNPASLVCVPCHTER
jgi:hypothetical protein